MEPSGAQAGPSVRPPSIFAERVKSSSSLAPLGTMASPVGAGVSSAWAKAASNSSERDACMRRTPESEWDEGHDSDRGGQRPLGILSEFGLLFPHGSRR